MTGSESDVHIGGNIQIGENVTNGVLVSIDVFSAQRPVRERFIRYCMT